VRAIIYQGRSPVILPTTPVPVTAVSARSVFFHATGRVAFRGCLDRRKDPTRLRRRESLLRPRRGRRMHTRRHLVELDIRTIKVTLGIGWENKGVRTLCFGQKKDPDTNGTAGHFGC